MKQIPKNDFITSLLKGAVGPDADVATFPVWEVVATSTVPLRGKGGTIFENAVIKANTLFQLAALVNREPFPLMLDHNMEGSPKGKFFYGEVLPNEFGHQELRGYKYIDPTETDLVAKTDNGTIDEVSIAFDAERMTCNKCGYDFKAALKADDIMPLITRTCANGHVIGSDGTHLELDGVEEGIELSLVSRGAAKNSKIIGQSDSKLGMQAQRLAAHGLDINDYIVTASVSVSEGNDDMDLKDLVVQLSDKSAKLAVAENDVQRLERELAEATGARNEAETRARQAEADLATARQEAANAPAPEAVEQAEKDSKSTKASVEFLQKQYVAVLSAAGETNVTAPDSVEDLITGIEKYVPELSAILPIGGVSLASNGNGPATKADYSMFKVR